MAYKDNDEKLIAKNLKQLRMERYSTQQSFADDLGYDRTMVAKWENGSKISNCKNT